MVSRNAAYGAGDIAFYAGHSWQDRLIQWGTHGIFTHCEVVRSPLESYAALSTNGVVRHALPEPLAVARVGASCDPARRARGMAWLESCLGNGYSQADILADAAKAILPRWLGARAPFLVTPSRYDCSALVAIYLLIAGVALPAELVADVYRCSPNDLARALGLLKERG